MSRKLAPRLESSEYLGCQRYFITICTHNRVGHFLSAPAVTMVLEQLRHCAATQDIAIHAYCLMPDHAHVVLEGRSASSNLPEFMRQWKQSTAFYWRRSSGGQLWQRGYYDRVLRPDEDTAVVSRYVLANPVRAGLVADPTAYPFQGSDTTTMENLLWRAADRQWHHRNRRADHW